ncbi:MAG: GTP-binding protein [Hyphomicrobium sp.]|nr:GTP-binding protein [Hyphomicrobium sp.]
MTPRKIMLLGDIGVGKSSIVRRLVFDEFDHNYKPTLGVDVYSCEITPDISTGAPPAKFVIWDTDGNFGDSILSLVYIREATAALVVGDLTRPATISTMLDLGRNFLQALPGRYCGFLLNKSDMTGEQSELPPELANSSIPAVRTSAKTGENIKHAFLAAADAIRRRGL